MNCSHKEVQGFDTSIFDMYDLANVSRSLPAKCVLGRNAAKYQLLAHGQRVTVRLQQGKIKIQISVIIKISIYNWEEI